MPAFLQSSPFTAKLFRATVERFAHERPGRTVDVRGRPVALAAIAASWLHHETTGARLRMAHRCVEWDGWEEGLVGSILGPEEQEEDWFGAWQEDGGAPASHRDPALDPEDDGLPELAPGEEMSPDSDAKPESPVATISPTLLAFPLPAAGVAGAEGERERERERRANGVPKVVVAVEKEREKLLNATGDFCGGRGGELGRRLEAWLYVNGDEDGRVGLGRRWEGEDEDDE